MGLIWTPASRAFVIHVLVVMVVLMAEEMKTPAVVGSRVVIWRAFRY